MPIKDIVWRGAQPLREGDPLVGRDSELDEFIHTCQSYDVVTVTAASGVGKSSFVTAGAIGRLRELDVDVLPNLPWVQALSRVSPETISDEPASASDLQKAGRLLYCAALGFDDPAERFGDRSRPQPVVLLDQFEECLRYNQDLGQAVLRSALRAARQFKVAHVIVARSEYRWQLRPVETRDSWWHIELPEISDPAVLREIVAEPARVAGVSVEDAVLDRIVDDWWVSARRGRLHPGSGFVQGSGRAPVGLLHLQSLLWLLREWLLGEGRGDDSIITLSDLDGFAKSSPEESEGFGGSGLIALSMVKYVGATMDRALGQNVLVGSSAPSSVIDRLDQWPIGPKLMAARAARFLSTAGYKIPQSYPMLLSLALSDEIQPEQARKIAAVAGGSPMELATLMTDLSPAGIASDWPVLPVPGEASSGSVAEVLAWSLRGSLDVLTGSDQNILRPFTRGDEAIYELVHDGLGVALETWAHRFLERPIAALDLITARIGRPMRHDLTVEHLAADDQTLVSWSANLSVVQREPKVTLGMHRLVWTGNSVRDVDIRDVDFDACDFTGTVFHDVRLHGVRFLDCVLRGFYAQNLLCDDVTFAVGDSSVAGLDTMVINGVTDGRVRFMNLPDTTGMSLFQIAGGQWLFDGCAIRHLVIEGAAGSVNPADITFRRCNIEHVTFGNGLLARIGFEGATVRHATFDSAGITVRRVRSPIEKISLHPDIDWPESD